MSTAAIASTPDQPLPQPTASTSRNNEEDEAERPQRDQDDEERGEEEAGSKDGYQCTCLPSGLFGSSLLVENRGSTARDYLARERNWLSWVKLSTTLAVISAAMLLRFQFGEQIKVPGYEVASEIPLGILFSIAAGASLLVGVGGHFSYDQLMRRQAGFVYSGKPTQIVVWSICGLTIAACVLLLVAGDA
ncbi:hypothetical protein BCR35DRAFT_306737 [Leucosporidium creatinivorum]|uniref:DUF202 domain-containing protein n=1 Tax=Leucosporidium creatinivorum TaxID=106004 RepID=A0A1Y2ET01_9BASI|nr:hypothetical protein BCR35DRAFT_306737 [Leucosporidium creatinivorum]